MYFLSQLCLVVTVVQSRPRAVDNPDSAGGSWMELLSMGIQTPLHRLDDDEEIGISKAGIVETNANPGPPLHDKFCGTRPGFQEGGPSKRIIGGEVAMLGQFPWQVALVKVSGVKGGKPMVTCGGTIVSARTVITAAHCLKLPPTRFQVWVGSTTSEITTDDYNQQKLMVMKYFKHPEFNSVTLRNDIAIVSILTRYGQGVRWTDFILPACLPAPQQSDLYQGGSTGMVSGWGALDENHLYMSSTLQHVSVPLMTLEQCKAAYDGLTTIEDTQLCAGVNKGGRDACAGDSGGPLVVEDSDTDRLFLAGVVSFGLGCGRADYPGVYTRVEKFVPWVLKHVAKIEGGVVSQYIENVVEKATSKPVSPPHFPTTTATKTTTTTTKTTTTTTKTTTTTTKTTTTTTKTTTTTTKTTTTTTKSTTTTRRTTTPRPTSHRLAAMCYFMSRKLECRKAGTVIKVTYAFYGRSRTDWKSCPIPWYYRGADCSLSSATKDLSRACDGKIVCPVSTRPGWTNPFMRNPCSRQRPYVTVQYDCVAK